MVKCCENMCEQCQAIHYTGPLNFEVSRCRYTGTSSLVIISLCTGQTGSKHMAGPYGGL